MKIGEPGDTGTGTTRGTGEAGGGSGGAGGGLGGGRRLGGGGSGGGRSENSGRERKKSATPHGLFHKSSGVSVVGFAGQSNKWLTDWESSWQFG